MCLKLHNGYYFCNEYVKHTKGSHTKTFTRPFTVLMYAIIITHKMLHTGGVFSSCLLIINYVSFQYRAVFQTRVYWLQLHHVSRNPNICVTFNGTGIPISIGVYLSLQVCLQIRINTICVLQLKRFISAFNVTPSQAYKESKCIHSIDNIGIYLSSPSIIKIELHFQNGTYFDKIRPN